jgi:hypothetical protein
MSKVILNVAFPDEWVFGINQTFYGENQLFNFFIASFWKELWKTTEYRYWMGRLYDFSKPAWFKGEDELVPRPPIVPQHLLDEVSVFANLQAIIVDDDTKIVKEAPDCSHYNVGDIYDPERWKLSGWVLTQERAEKEYDAMMNTVAFSRKVGLDALMEKYEAKV